MRKSLTAVALLVSASAWAEPPALSCDAGPANKTFGGNSWLVYGCNDGRSVVVVSAPGSPATPFYFMFSYEKGAYKMRGEGTGSKAATDAAFTELGKLKENQIVHLFSEAVSAKTK